MPPTDSSFAFNIADFQLDPAAERFFSQSVLEQEEPALLPRAQRRAMRATFAMLGLFAVALTSFLFYTRVVMPLPAELGADAMQAELPLSTSASAR